MFSEFADRLLRSEDELLDGDVSAGAGPLLRRSNHHADLVELSSMAVSGEGECQDLVDRWSIERDGLSLTGMERLDSERLSGDPLGVSAL